MGKDRGIENMTVPDGLDRHLEIGMLCQWLFDQCHKGLLFLFSFLSHSPLYNSCPMYKLSGKWQQCVAIARAVISKRISQ